MPLVESIPPGPDTIRILFTTDNHVGAFENDPIRGDDGWKTFHEISKIAKEQDVDMLLQGGDLFHINKPSKKSLYHVMKSIRLNCFGDRPCELELLSDPSQCLNNGFDNVNYEDPNLNVSIPIFAISGNHDDATGEGLLLAMDVLAVSGLVNHFGKIKDTENITISPILFQKGLTKLALYGMANLRDERLHRAFRDGIVKFQRPKIQLDEWFNLFAIHQNHAAHTLTSSIPENFLPSFLDFVVWGHEHECIPYPVHNPETGFDVLQAGSSIATSLSEGEVAEKKVFVINIKGKDYSIEPIKLTTVRPFVLRTLELLRTNLITGPASKSDVLAYLTEEVEKAIQIANKMYKDNNPDLFDEGDEESEANNSNIPLPLIRLKVEYSGGFEIENVRRFSNRFVGKIANSNDVIQFYKKREKPVVNIGKKVKFDKDLINESIANTKTTELQLQDIISDFMGQTRLTLLPETGLHEAVKKFIDNDDKTSLNQYIEKEVKNETKILLSIDIDEGEFHGDDENHARKVFKQILQQVKQSDVVLPDVQEEEPEKPTKKATTSKRKSAKSKDVILSEDSDNEILESSPRRTTTRGSLRTKQKSYAEDDDIDDLMLSSDDEYQAPKKTAARRAGAGRGRGRGRSR